MRFASPAAILASTPRRSTSTRWRRHEAAGKGRRPAFLRPGEHHAAARDRARQRRPRRDDGDGDALGKTLRKNRRRLGQRVRLHRQPDALRLRARSDRILAEEGVAPERIDNAIKAFGLAMGPFAMFDLSGIDVFWHIQQEAPEALRLPHPKIIDRLYELKRFGQKTAPASSLRAGKPRAASPIPSSSRTLREEAQGRHRAPRRDPTPRSSSGCVRARQRRRELAREGVALRPAISTSSTSTATASRRITAARCGADRSASKRFTTKSRVHEALGKHWDARAAAQRSRTRPSRPSKGAFNSCLKR
jgi:hypothetical protein